MVVNPEADAEQNLPPVNVPNREKEARVGARDLRDLGVRNLSVCTDCAMCEGDIQYDETVCSFVFVYVYND